jgi:dephospho-CoA kinase
MRFLAGLEQGSILCLMGGIGRGKTTILRQMHDRTGGAFLNANAFLKALTKAHPSTLEETYYQAMIAGGDGDSKSQVEEGLRSLDQNGAK